MQLKEFRDLEEVGTVPTKADSYIQSRRGYRFMDSGSDQYAYQMPRGSYVFKIFGGHRDIAENPQLSPSQAMYLQWVQYCVDHAASNKFLPRFRRAHGRYWHERVLDGRLLIVTIQELLTKNADRALELSRLSDLLSNERKLVLGLISGEIDPDQNHDPDDAPSWTQRVARQINRVREQFTEADFKLWIDTVLLLQDHARAGGWGWDLHPANIMFRGPTPVILDPWHTWHETWDQVANMERLRDLDSSAAVESNDKQSHQIVNEIESVRTSDVHIGFNPNPRTQKQLGKTFGKLHDGFAYNITQYGRMISIYYADMPDEYQEVAYLATETYGYIIPGARRVDLIAVHPQFRKQGLATKLYEIYFKKIGRYLVAGAQQSPGGQRNWVSLANNPNIEVVGLLGIDDYEFNISDSIWGVSAKAHNALWDKLMDLGARYLKKSEMAYWFLVPVKNMGRQLEVLKHFRLYRADEQSSSVYVDLLAQWRGR